MLPVLARFNGSPRVDASGNIVYEFPELQQTAGVSLGAAGRAGRAGCGWVAGGVAGGRGGGCAGLHSACLGPHGCGLHRLAASLKRPPAAARVSLRRPARRRRPSSAALARRGGS